MIPLWIIPQTNLPLAITILAHLLTWYCWHTHLPASSTLVLMQRTSFVRTNQYGILSQVMLYSSEDRIVYSLVTFNMFYTSMYVFKTIVLSENLKQKPKKTLLKQNSTMLLTFPTIHHKPTHFQPRPHSENSRFKCIQHESVYCQLFSPLHSIDYHYPALSCKSEFNTRTFVNAETFGMNLPPPFSLRRGGEQLKPPAPCHLHGAHGARQISSLIFDADRRM